MWVVVSSTEEVVLYVSSVFVAGGRVSLRLGADAGAGGEDTCSGVSTGSRDGCELEVRKGDSGVCGGAEGRLCKADSLFGVDVGVWESHWGTPLFQHSSTETRTCRCLFRACVHVSSLP